MIINGHHVYFGERFMNEHNHQRVVRLLREMDVLPHLDRRSEKSAALRASEQAYSFFGKLIKKLKRIVK